MLTERRKQGYYTISTWKTGYSKRCHDAQKGTKEDKRKLKEEKRDGMRFEKRREEQETIIPCLSSKGQPSATVAEATGGAAIF